MAQGNRTGSGAGQRMHKDRQAELALSYVRIARRRVREYHDAGALVHPAHLAQMELVLFNAESLLMAWDLEGHLPEVPILHQIVQKGQ